MRRIQKKKCIVVLFFINMGLCCVSHEADKFYRSQLFRIHYLIYQKLSLQMLRVVLPSFKSLLTPEKETIIDRF